MGRRCIRRLWVAVARFRIDPCGDQSVRAPVQPMAFAGLDKLTGGSCLPVLIPRLAKDLGR